MPQILKTHCSLGEKMKRKTSFGRQWPNFSLNKDFDTKTWTDAAPCLRGDFIIWKG